VVQSEEHKKKLGVHLPPKTKKVELENQLEVHDRIDEEEVQRVKKRRKKIHLKL
jgi:hypothetical protein